MRNWKPWEKSTGPKSAAGKKRVARNAYKHGNRSAQWRELRYALRLQARYLAHVKLCIKLLKNRHPERSALARSRGIFIEPGRERSLDYARDDGKKTITRSHAFSQSAFPQPCLSSAASAHVPPSPRQGGGAVSRAENHGISAYRPPLRLSRNLSSPLQNGQLRPCSLSLSARFASLIFLRLFFGCMT